MRIRVAAVTGSRAEFGLLRPILQELRRRADVDLKLAVTGLHLLAGYGNTIEDIRKSGIPIEGTVPMYEGEIEDPLYHGRALARGVDGFTRLLSEWRPHWVLVLGDRLEPLAAVLAASTLNRAIAHIHGGDRATGSHIDEQIRHAITKFAHLHLAATKASAERVRKLGEEPWRIHIVGAPALDAIRTLDLPAEADVRKRLALPPSGAYGVFVYHATIHGGEQAGEEARTALAALVEATGRVVALRPNNDAGNQHVRAALASSDASRVRAFDHLEPALYYATLAHAGVMVGNSSSGIIEARFFGLPVVNVGERNRGRECAKNVAFVDAEPKAVKAAIARSLGDKAYRKLCRACPNPYGKGNASKGVADALEKLAADERVLKKGMTY